MSLPDLSSLITTLAIIIAGLWTLYRFGLGRERFPKLEFVLDMHQLGLSRDKHVVELVATITNKGIARQYIKDFTFNILTFDDNTPFDLSDASIEKRLKFNKLENGLRWENPDHDPFVDGGVKNRFSYVTAFDRNMKFVMVYSKFKQRRGWFGGKEEVNHISRTFAVQENTQN